jgi:hypothetical protein
MELTRDAVEYKSTADTDTDDAALAGAGRSAA